MAFSRRRGAGSLPSQLHFMLALLQLLFMCLLSQLPLEILNLRLGLRQLAQERLRTLGAHHTGLSTATGSFKC